MRIHRAILAFVLLSISSLARAEDTLHMPCNPEPIDFQAQFQLSDRFLPQNVYPALWAAYVAEMDDQSTIRSILSSWKLDQILFLGSSYQGASAYLAETPQYRLLVFRGSTTWLEKGADALFASRSFESIGLPGRGHSGMYYAFKALWPSIHAEVSSRNQKEEKPLVIIGHSLGGALGLMHALKFVDEGLKVDAIYASGQPRVGDQDFYDGVKAKIGTRYYRIERPDDFTSQIPPSAAASDSFASVFSEPGNWLHWSLDRFVQAQNYARPEGLKIELTEGFPVLEGTELRDEQNFWGTFEKQYDALQSLSDISTLIKEQARRHPPGSYLCEYLKLSGKIY